MRKMLWLRELCSFMSEEEESRGKRTRALIWAPQIKRHSFRSLSLRGGALGGGRCALSASPPHAPLTFAPLILLASHCEGRKKVWMSECCKINRVTHWLRRHDGSPSLHLSHPLPPRGSWQIALCSPEGKRKKVLSCTLSNNNQQERLTHKKRYISKYRTKSSKCWMMKVVLFFDLTDQTVTATSRLYMRLRSAHPAQCECLEQRDRSAD